MAAVRAIPVRAPLTHVTAHVIDAQLIRQFGGDRLRDVVAVIVKPADFVGIHAS